MSTNGKTIGIGLIGCGGRLSGVIKRTIEGADALEVRALFDPCDQAVERCRKSCACPDATRYEDFQALVKDERIDWVGIGSFNAFHKEHIQAALEAGKHVFSEKPIVTNFEDALALKKVAEKSDVIFSMGFVLRYAPFYRRLKELIVDGVLGELVSFEFNETLGFNHGGFIMSNWRRKRELSGTHVLEKCCHDFDLANWLVDSVPVRTASFGGLDFYKPENIRHVDRIGKDKKGNDAYSGMGVGGIYQKTQRLNPFTSDKDIADNQVVILEYANGVRGTFHSNMNAALPERRFYICGTEGAVRGDVLRGEIEWRRIGHDPARICERTVGGGHGGADGILSASIRKSMLEGAAPDVGWVDGIKAAVACFGVDAAMDTGEVVDLKPLWEKLGFDPGKESGS